MEHSKGLHEFGQLRGRRGKVVGRMFAAANALAEDADGLSRGLCLLSETLIRGLLPDQRGGGLGGEFGYGCDYENDVFMMHHYCWCEKRRCGWCNGSKPHFLHKPTGFSVRWYKWIGRDMEPSNPQLTGAEWAKIFRQCWRSIPVTARRKAEKGHNHDHSPKVVAAREKQMARTMEVMMNPEKYGAPKQKTNCSACGKEYEYCDWGTRIVSQCDECSKKMWAKMRDGAQS